MRSQILKFFVLGLLVASFQFRTAQGGLVLQVLDTQLAAGGPGFVDIMLSGTGDLIESASLQMQITPINSVTSSLQFRNPQIVSFETDPSYIFTGNSFNQLFNLDPRIVSQTQLQNDTFATNDSTADVTNQSLTTARLLARVNLIHVVPQGTDPTTVVNDQFQIQVRLEGTSFRDALSSPVDFTSSGPGLVSITAVPEPSSALLLLICLAMIVKRWSQAAR